MPIYETSVASICREARRFRKTVLNREQELEIKSSQKEKVFFMSKNNEKKTVKTEKRFKNIHRIQRGGFGKVTDSSEEIQG